MDWFDIAKDITNPVDQREAYDWLLFNIVNDIKEALEFVPIEVLQHDLEYWGIFFGGLDATEPSIDENKFEAPVGREDD